MVTRDGFEAAMEYIRGSLQAPTSQHARAMLLLNKLFDLFEPNEADAVDFVELCTGLSVLCAGNREDKVEAAFRLFGACPCFPRCQWLPRSRFRQLLSLPPPPFGQGLRRQCLTLFSS